MNEPRTVKGVGKGSQTAQYEVTITGGLQDFDGELYEEVYKAPCLENSGVPALMGIQSLRRNDALIRCRTGEICFLGQGGWVNIEPSPGIRHFQMQERMDLVDGVQKLRSPLGVRCVPGRCWPCFFGAHILYVSICHILMFWMRCVSDSNTSATRLSGFG